MQGTGERKMKRKRKHAAGQRKLDKQSLRTLLRQVESSPE